LSIEILKSKMKFIVIGGQKCGTTFIQSVLSQSKLISTPYLKETDFFSNNYEKGLSFYSNYFTNQDAEIFGEISGLYMQKLSIASKILESFPKIKIILIARNPIDAVVSGYYHMIQHKDSEGINKFIEDLSYDNKWLLRWMYFKHIDEYSGISKKMVKPKVLFFDDLIKNKKMFVKNLFDYIGIKGSNSISFDKIEQNEAKTVRFQWLGGLMHKSYINIRKYNLSILRELIEKSNIKKILYRKGVSKEQLSDNNRIKLIDIYINDIKKLEKYTGRNLSNWYNSK